MSDDSDVEEEQSGGGFQLALLRSYAAFIRRAIRAHLVLSLAFLGVGIVLTFATFRYLPRTFVCSTVMMGEGSKVFDDWQPQPFAAAGNLIRSKENLEAIARGTKLAKTFSERRPPLLKAKDDVLQAIFGKWNDDTINAIVVGTLESRIDVASDGSTMTINVSWTDGVTAAEVAEAARESFFQIRRKIETSAFTEKLAILDRHATTVRQEVEQLAEQIRGRKVETPVRAAPPTSASPSAPLPPHHTGPLPHLAEGPDPQLAKNKAELETMKRRLSDLESDRERQLRDERAKLADLRLKLAPSHPNVLTSEQRIQMLSQVPADVALLRAEVAGLEQEVIQREAMSKFSAGSARGAAAAPSADAEPLPAAITELLDKDDVDQALVAQLSGAITQYGALRAQIRHERVDVDTAEAAFNQRYRVVVPVETPTQPVKPRLLVVFAAGLGASLLLALLLPVLLELRKGIIVESWQVHHLQLPVLAELRLPPRSGE